jgi:hypothetical protein
MEFQIMLGNPDDDNECLLPDNDTITGDSYVHDTLLEAIAEYECDDIDNVADIYSP